ncbi:UDP-2,3-diacylglucosamine diphosphatase [Segetibacter sp. 3557_3]|uniref:UDP-2,3-diacylglucosamine diphosphatase n=1 Tax=Segetibacter sp. 3557_3 TaxID=2547429 RepID=UPI001058E03C|nr:UDP-2,3-diacylglucosamine diphosphatase [Segetibacter sp. 3557_3]TDH23271.1 UDP-2,3-diacylglucosamine diphosphatase [Segetibacter sp. 3557_3]
MKNDKRVIDILVISDVHLGTYGCHAKELLHYLKGIRPKLVILNGDIIDIWQFSKNYWPKSHMKVVKHLFGWIGKGVKTYYITGNHDEMLRKFVGLKMGSFRIVNKVVLDLPGDKKAWFFHGDVFDVTMQHSKWLAKLGAVGYDTLILINRFANFISERVFNRGKISLSKKIKDGVKSAVSFINNFEQTSADIGISNQYDYVVCGHIHQPAIRTMTNQQGSITYLNSGDWIENLSSLEYVDGAWSIYRFNSEERVKMNADEEVEELLNNDQLFNNLLSEFNLMRS